jgi:Fic family protein
MIAFADPIDLDALRIRHEFLTLPDLHTSAENVAALLGVTERHALVALDALVAEGFLERIPDRQYARRAAVAPAPTETRH